MTSYDNDIQLLLERYPHIHDDLVTCDDDRCTINATTIPSVWNDHNERSCLVNIRCTVCHQIWTLCTGCKLKKKMLKQEQVKRHIYKYHDKKRKCISIESLSKQSKRKSCDENHDDTDIGMYKHVIVFISD